MRRTVEFVCLLPLTIPAIVLVVGLAPVYAWVTYFLGESSVWLCFAYVVLVLPYAYRALDAGLRAIDVKTLAEAARSLGASWFTVMWRVILPNIRTAVLLASFLSVALVLGEFTIASLLNRDNLQVAINLLGKRNASISIAVSFAALLRRVPACCSPCPSSATAAASAAPRRAECPPPSRPSANATATKGVGVRLTDLRRSYGTVRALDGLTLSIEPGELVALLGPLGLRQDHRPAAAGRPGGRRRGPRRGGRPRHHHGAHQQAGHGDGVPGVQPVPAHDDPAERRVRAAAARHRRGQAPRTGHRDAGARGPGDPGRPLRPPALRRAAAAGRPGPGPRHRSRRCCCSTSRCRPSTPRCGCSCGRRSAGSSSRSARRRCSSPTTRRRPSPSPTASGSCAPATSSSWRPPGELYARPATAFVADFVGLTNRLAATVESGRAHVLGASVPLLPGSAAVRGGDRPHPAGGAGRDRGPGRHRHRRQPRASSAPSAG